MLALCFVVGGCGRQKAETKLPPVMSKSEKGHAYVAALMPAHPLYGELRALQQHIDALRGLGLSVPATQIGQQWDSPVIVPPVVDEHLDSLQWYRGQWPALSPPPQPGVLDELPRDLKGRLSWEISRIEREVRQELAEGRAQESQWLAYLQIEAMQRRQGEVSAQELDLSTPADEARAMAERLRQQIIREAVEEEAKASEERLQTLSETLEKQKQETIAQLERELRERARQRRSYSTGLGRELQEQLANRIEQFVGPVSPYDDLVVGPSPNTEQLLETDHLRRAAEREYQQVVSAQIKRLIAQQMALTVVIERATRRAARRIAWEQHLELRLLPGDSKTGKELTPLVAASLAAMWAPQASALHRRASTGDNNRISFGPPGHSN